MRYGVMPGYVVELGSWLAVGLKGTLCVTGPCQAMHVVELGSWLSLELKGILCVTEPCQAMYVVELGS